MYRKNKNLFQKEKRTKRHILGLWALSKQSLEPQCELKVELGSVWPEESNNPNIEVRRQKSGWPICNDLAKFSRKTGIRFSVLIVDLELNRLD